MYSCDLKAAITPVIWLFRNHCKMLIWCSRNVSYCYQCWKELWCLIFLWKQGLTHTFSTEHMWS